MDKVEMALAYAAKGWRIVVLGPGSKIPIEKAWTSGATADPEEIRLRISKHQGCNIGVATGRGSGIWVLDVDPRNGGDESLATLQRNIGPLETLMCRTPSGGLHYYFRYPASQVPNGGAPLGRGLDIKSDGGQVVLPPSMVNGREYSFVDAETPISETPISLLQLLVKRRTGQELLAEYRGNAIQTAWEPGNRNNSLFAMCCALRAKGASDSAILAFAEAENASHTNPLPSNEVSQTVLSACKYPPGTPQKNFEPPHTPRSDPTDMQQLYTRQNAYTSCSDIRQVGPSKAAELQEEQTANKKQSVFCQLEEFARLADSDPEIGWILDQLVPAEGLTLFVAAPGVGKTWLALIAAKASLEQGRDVFLVEEEGSRRGLMARVRALGIKEPEGELAGRMFVAHRIGRPLTDDAYLAEMAEAVDGSDRPVIMFDALANFYPGDEDTPTTKEICQRFRFLERVNPRVSIQVLHHTSKVGERGESGSSVYASRGSTVLPGWFDQIVNLKSEPKVNGSVRFTVEVAKARDNPSEEPKSFNIDLGSGEVSIKAIRKEVNYEERIVTALKRRSTPVTKTELIGSLAAQGRQWAVHEAVDRLFEKGLIEQVGRGGWRVKRQPQSVTRGRYGYADE